MLRGHHVQYRRRILGRWWLALVLGLWLGYASPASAVLEARVTSGSVDPIPMALAPFIASSDDQALAANIEQVVNNDLASSGLFRFIDRKAFIAVPANISVLPRFTNWRVIGTKALVQGALERGADGQMVMKFRLWDVLGEKQLIGKRYVVTKKNWRRVAHNIADGIYVRMTGEKSGYFDTRIVYVAETGPHKRRVKRLAIMDQDGANHQFLTSGRYMVLTPRFSPALQQITYMSYAGNKPRVYLYNLSTGEDKMLGDFPGMTFAPRFSPDGKTLVMSYSQDGNSDIYTMNLASSKVKRLTRHQAIDTSPSFSPDGQSIVFNSDRGGKQNLYVMDASGRNIRRISFGQGRYATPVWSPRGDMIAYTKVSGGQFTIGIMGPDGSGERQLASGFLVEGPSWAPNGRVLTFFRQQRMQDDGSGGRSRVYTIDITGYNERELATPLDASDPAWSPLLK